jgi:hypothetical protein
MTRSPAHRPRRHLVWLLAVALLLPIAQTAATWHVLSMACIDQADLHGKPPSHPTRCDFCLTAAGFHSGAATSVALAAPRPVSLHEAPRHFASPFVGAAPAWGYRSRAPPVAL